MGIDDLIRILLFAAFFWPLLSGLFKKRQPPQKSPPQKGQRPRPSRPPERQSSAERPVTGIPKTGLPPQTVADASPRPSGSAPVGNFEKRLEEARQRVREAMETGEPSSKPTGRRSSSAAPSAQPERGMFKEPAQPTLLSGNPRQASPPQDVSVQRLESAPRTFAPPQAKSGYAIAKTSFGEKSDPLKVTRLRRKSRKATRGQTRIEQSEVLVDMSKTSILRGFVWQQILSEPKAKQARAKRSHSNANRRTP